MTESVELWVDLAPYLVGREILIEHFSNSVSGEDFANCQEKIAHAVRIFESIPRKNRGDRKCPSLVILSHQQPDRLLKLKGTFEATDSKGIWVRRPLELGAIFLVVTTRLPAEPRYDWLRMTTRIPETSEEFRAADALMKQAKLDILTKRELQEEIMEMIIDGKTPIDLRNENIELKAGKKAAEAEMRAAEAEKKAAEERVSTLEHEVHELKKLLTELRTKVE